MTISVDPKYTRTARLPTAEIASIVSHFMLVD